MPLGLNLAAAALLGAVLASGSESGGLGAQWPVWPWLAGGAALIGFLAFRFPRAAGIPLALALGAAGWSLSAALTDFVPLAPGQPSVRVQPLTDRETVTAFALRADFVEVPVSLPLVPRAWVRLRAGDAAPSDGWWSWAEGLRWARSVGAPLPPDPLKFATYRLSLAEGTPRWDRVVPELAVTDTR